MTTQKSENRPQSLIFTEFSQISLWKIRYRSIPVHEIRFVVPPLGGKTLLKNRLKAELQTFHHDFRNTCRSYRPYCNFGAY